VIATAALVIGFFGLNRRTLSFISWCHARNVSKENEPGPANGEDDALPRRTLAPR
jgi:hypothetical protein